MATRTNYYKDLSADYSRPGLVSAELAQKLLRDAERYVALREDTVPQISPEYNLAQIEEENKEWRPTHCEALRQGRGDLLVPIRITPWKALGSQAYQLFG